MAAQQPSRTWIKGGAIALGGIVLLLVLQQSGVFMLINQGLDQAIAWVDRLGAWGLIAFTGIYILASLLCLSGAALTLGAGALFGVVQGSILVSIASTLAATCAFLVGRYGVRDWVARQIESRPTFKAIDQVVARDGLKVVWLTRLSPLFPFVFLNYAFGLTHVSLRDYVLASWLGMMPGTVLYVYLGAAGKAAANAVESGTFNPETGLKTALTLVGLVATLIVTVWITKSAQRALNEQIEE